MTNLPEFTWVCDCGRRITAQVAKGELVRCRDCDKLYNYETISRAATESSETNQIAKGGGNAAAIAVVTIVIGGLCLLVSPILAIALIMGGMAGAVVYDDAQKRGDPNPGAWALGTWLLLIIVLPLYLYHRAYGTRPQGQEKATTTPQVPLGKHCGFCGKLMPANYVFCPACGKAQE